MPQTEFAQLLKAGEQAVVSGPGVVEFKTLSPALGGAKAVTGKGLITTTTAASANGVPASFLSGKVLGFSLASVNPWILLAIGVTGGYLLARKKFPKLVW